MVGLRTGQCLQGKGGAFEFEGDVAERHGGGLHIGLLHGVQAQAGLERVDQYLLALKHIPGIMNFPGVVADGLIRDLGQVQRKHGAGHGDPGEADVKASGGAIPLGQADHLTLGHAYGAIEVRVIVDFYETDIG